MGSEAGCCSMVVGSSNVSCDEERSCRAGCWAIWLSAVSRLCCAILCLREFISFCHVGGASGLGGGGATFGLGLGLGAGVSAGC